MKLILRLARKSSTAVQAQNPIGLLEGAFEELLSLIKTPDASSQLRRKTNNIAIRIWEDCFKELDGIYERKEYSLFLRKANEVVEKIEPHVNIPRIAAGLANLYVQRADVYRERGSDKYENAIQDYKKALLIDKNHPAAKKGLQAVAIECGEYPIKNYYPFQPTMPENHKPN